VVEVSVGEIDVAQSHIVAFNPIDQGIAGDSPGVGDLRTLRDAIRRSLVERDHDPDRDDGARPAAVESVVRVRFEADGTVRFVPGPVGIPALGQRVLRGSTTPNSLEPGAA
jgi:hypothetical protein